MPLLNSQIDRQGMGTLAVVGLFTLFAFAFAVDSYVKWPPRAVAAVSMHATASLASDPNLSDESLAHVEPLKGQTGCPVGKRSLPTQLTPLP
jgi:hypothetical protein